MHGSGFFRAWGFRGLGFHRVTVQDSRLLGLRV